jgi:hypothetical protein
MVRQLLETFLDENMDVIVPEVEEVEEEEQPIPDVIIFLFFLNSCSVHYHRPTTILCGNRPLYSLAMPLDSRLLASSFCQPFCANRRSTWPEGVLHYVYRDAVSTLESRD